VPLAEFVGESTVDIPAGEAGKIVAYLLARGIAEFNTLLVFPE